MKITSMNMMTKMIMMKITTTTIMMTMITMMIMTTKMTMTKMIKEAVAAEEDPEEETETSKETAREDLLPEEADQEVIPVAPVGVRVLVLVPDPAAEAGHHQEMVPQGEVLLL